MENRHSLSLWVYNMHNLVNKKLGKSIILTYEQVRDTYEHFRSRCDKTQNFNNKEKGCVKPLYGKKKKCVINIVSADHPSKSFNVDPKCVLWSSDIIFECLLGILLLLMLLLMLLRQTQTYRKCSNCSGLSLPSKIHNQARRMDLTCNIYKHPHSHLPIP